MYSITALVPMKGQSERVKGKNLRPFLGNPLCFYILDALQKSTYIQRIIINTDSLEIANVCKKFSKVTIHDRVKEIQGHHIPMNMILDWDINNDDKPVEHYLQTHVTNPLLTHITINKAIESYFTNINRYDSLFSVTPFQSRLYTEEGQGMNHDTKKLINTQDLPKLFEENSNIYIFSKNSFNSAKQNRIGLKPYMFEIDKSEALDIDTEEDFLIAQAAYQALRNS